MLGAISYQLDAAKFVASDELFKHWFVFTDLYYFVNLNDQVAQFWTIFHFSLK